MKPLHVFLFCLMLLSNACQVTAQDQAMLSSDYDQLLEKYFDADGPGATALVVKKGQVLYKGAIGKADLENDVAMKVGHVHRIGSITKQFTAVSILMLMEQGKLKLQDDITRFIPDYPTKGKTVTVEHLLTHTSGIRSMTSMPGFFEAYERRNTSAEEMMDYFKNEPFDFEPGTQYRYNNSGYYLLGVIIEKASGMSYADFVKKNIFDKVGMKNSYYDNAQQIIPMRAAGYVKEGDEYRNANFLDMSVPYAAGSLLSTVEDWYLWNQALRAGKLIKKESLEMAFTPYELNNGEKINYGYGWGIGKMFGSRVVQHGGGIHGFLTQGTYLPAEDVYVAVFSNCNCQPADGAAEALAAIASEKYTSKKKISLSEAELKEYVGVYQVEDQQGKRTILMDGDHLTSQRSGRDLYNIFPYEKDRFFFENNLTTFEFVRDANGKIKGMNATALDGNVSYAALTDEEPLIRKAIEVAPEILQQYVGDYELVPGFNIVVTVKDGRLMGQPTNQGNYQLFAESETFFFLKVVDAQVEFLKDEAGVFNKMKLMQGGQVMIGNKQE
ncbi:MAG: serine hydrolase [Bacteroidota bacterium]